MSNYLRAVSGGLNMSYGPQETDKVGTRPISGKEGSVCVKTRDQCVKIDLKASGLTKDLTQDT